VAVPLPSPRLTASSEAGVSCQYELMVSVERWVRAQVAVGPTMGSWAGSVWVVDGDVSGFGVWPVGESGGDLFDVHVGLRDGCLVPPRGEGEPRLPRRGSPSDSVPGLVRGSAVEPSSRAVLAGGARWSPRKRSAKERPSQPAGPWGRVHQQPSTGPRAGAGRECLGGVRVMLTFGIDGNSRSAAYNNVSTATDSQRPSAILDQW